MSIRTKLSVLALSAISAYPTLVLATAPVPVPIPGRAITLDSIVRLVQRVINVGIVIATLAVVAMMVYGGFKMATAGSTPGDFDKGKTILFQAMWGALAIFAVGLIVNTIARFAANPESVI